MVKWPMCSCVEILHFPTGLVADHFAQESLRSVNWVGLPWQVARLVIGAGTANDRMLAFSPSCARPGCPGTAPSQCRRLEAAAKDANWDLVQEARGTGPFYVDRPEVGKMLEPPIKGAYG